MNCFIHNNKESVNYCTVCKRPICNECFTLRDGICPRCNNFDHKTIRDYNKRELKWFIPFIIIRFMFLYDVSVYFLTCLIKNYKINLESIGLGLIALALAFIPLLLNIGNYGFVKGLKYNIIGKRNAIVIADNKKEDSFVSWFSGIVTCGLLILILPISSIIFFIIDIIHLIIMIKDYKKHNKLVVKE